MNGPAGFETATHQALSSHFGFVPDTLSVRNKKMQQGECGLNALVKHRSSSVGALRFGNDAWLGGWVSECVSE